ncbi:ABC transporter permease [Paenibacillus flagellatus]|uniref:Protein lplB n=1 Tax=Paenibacillus flagellatus TaxID=2211139 RepID=A0A2V5KCA7_9BACL|nr:ABC transporter permease subunit [Paenibacillus flagellatus]PYI55794.1 protein lplB [Paenibacillus flagellatus]
MSTVTETTKTPGAAAEPGRFRLWLRSYWKNKYLMLMLLPCLLYFIVFKYLPMYGVIIAFKDYRLLDGIFGSDWNGLQNFRDLFTGRGFTRAFRNTIILSTYKLIFGFPAPIILALLLNELRVLVFKKVVQTLSYLPYFLSWVVLAGVFLEIFSPSRGVVNYIITSFGGEAIYFFGDKEWFRTLLVSTEVWKQVGWGSVIYLAALASVDTSLYEAAIVDGAGRWKQMIHITLPSLYPVITIMFIFAVGGVINDDFDQVFNFYNQAVYEVGDVLSTYTYRIGIADMQYGLATASGLFINVIALTLIIVTNMIVKRFSKYGLW